MVALEIGGAELIINADEAKASLAELLLLLQQINAEIDRLRERSPIPL